ncbi:MAG TPA: hypothetical protein VFA98_08590, partial [Thermoanaerobaculia bacterium]|nr:hypothetical protein [Thermoanaerobaculia bacterium]
RGERPPDVRLYFGDRLSGIAPVRTESGAGCRWSFEFPTAAVAPDRIIRIEAESERGARRLLAAETLRPYL